MPQQPPHQLPNHLPPRHHQPPFPKSPNIPDFLLTAISLLLFLTTSPKHHHHHHISLRPTNRRILRLTSTMSHHPKPPNPSSFPTPQSLSDWLKPRLPSDSFSTWGHSPGTKNIHNLWLELSDGETSLVDSTPPVRSLEVVCVRVRRHPGEGSVLVESVQEMSDGSVRKRGRPLSEKLKAGESVEAGANRAVKEELGSIIYEVMGRNDVDFDEVVKIVLDKYEREVEERDSVSYPGLPACYVLHNVDAYVGVLPEGEFVTEEDEGSEYGEECDKGFASEAVKVKKHFWKWVPADSL